MKRLFCLLLALSLAIPTFALAVSSQKLKELYASVDTLSGDELLALRVTSIRKSKQSRRRSRLKPHMS